MQNRTFWLTIQNNEPKIASNKIPLPLSQVLLRNPSFWEEFQIRGINYTWKQQQHTRRLPRAESQKSEGKG